jgi:hypothetical protein
MSINLITLAVLIYMKQYPTDRFCSFIFETPKSTMKEYIWNSINKLYKISVHELKKIDRMERDLNSVVYRGYRITVILDGVEQEVLNWKRMKEYVEMLYFNH